MHCQFVDCRSRPTSHSTNLHNETINYRPHSEIPLPMKSHRIFWTTASALMLLIVFIGFRKFFTSGHDSVGQIIPQERLFLVVVHGPAITAC